MTSPEPAGTAARPGLAAAARLRRLAEHLAAGQDADALWLASGLQRYLTEAPAGARLEDVLDLATSPGGTPWWRAERDARRDALLCQLAADLPGTTSARAHALAGKLRRYASTGWPLDRRRGSPLPDTPERRALFRLFTLDAAPPTSLRRLHELLSATSLSSSYPTRDTRITT